MKEPNFWSNPADRPGLAARVLAPLGAIYADQTARRVAKSGLEASVPVICIGNINAGGTGKTPTVIALSQRLIERGKSVHVVSRGYGGSLDGPLRVDERHHSADQVGDEPLLIAAFTPAWISKDRAAGVRAAQEDGADVILLDDGMQNGSVEKDATFVVVDAHRGFGNGRVIPAGPLREPISRGLARADAVISIGDAAAQDRFSSLWSNAVTVPRLSAELTPLQTGFDWTDQPVLAFAGIGHPEKFFATLKGLGANLLRAEALSDHQPLSTQLMTRLEIEALALGAQMVTTEKDAVRLPRAFRQKVVTLPVRLTSEDWSVLDGILARLGLE
ncbi:tetraacyldisaccharide 4'-kinase [Celeribacter sp.]|uniref:tetraacyldisaccharide 4'-kinase n=1 Tax=Celeribacter sp. TaxID=1890673 RepID=UPI003A8CFF81